MSSKKSADTQPLPLKDTLQDLAVIRAAEIDLSSVLQSFVGNEGANASAPSQNAEAEGYVKQSYDYVREARAAMRILHRGKADTEGGRVDAVRGELEQIVAGLE